MREFRSDELIDREATIHIFRNASDTPEEPHTHDFIEIVYILRGSATQTVNSESYEARHGDLIFINYGGGDEPYFEVWVDITEALCSMM